MQALILVGCVVAAMANPGSVPLLESTRKQRLVRWTVFIAGIVMILAGAASIE